VLEELTTENAKLMLEGQALRRLSLEHQGTIKGLEEVAERYRTVNRELQRECEEVRFRWEVAEKLRGQMKDHF